MIASVFLCVRATDTTDFAEADYEFCGRGCRIQLRSDGRERVKEALVAVLAAALMPPQGDNHSQQPEASQTPALWLNPGEDQVTVGEAVEMLSQAVTAYHGQDDPTRVRAADDKPAGCQVDIDRTRMFARVVNALGTGGALEAAADAVLDIGPTQQTLTSVAQIPEGDLSSFLPEAMNYSPRDQHINVVVGQQKTMDDLKNAQHRNWLVRTLVSSKQEDTALLCVEHLGTQIPFVYEPVVLCIILRASYAERIISFLWQEVKNASFYLMRSSPNKRIWGAAG